MTNKPKTIRVLIECSWRKYIVEFPADDIHRHSAMVGLMLSCQPVEEKSVGDKKVFVITSNERNISFERSDPAVPIMTEEEYEAATAQPPDPDQGQPDKI